MNRSVFVSSIVLSLALVLSSAPVFGEKIVITATRLDDPAPSSIAGKVPTAFSETIKVDKSSHGMIDLNEALKMASSIDLPDYGGAVTAPISLRGSNFHQTLIMIDGIPVSPVTGDMTDLSLYAIPEIRQIEIVKGGNGARFGRYAMGGAINLVTKDPEFRNSASLTSSTGTYGYSLHNALINTFYKDIGIMLNLTRSSADNDYLYKKEDGTTEKRLNNDYERTSINSKIRFDAGGWDTLISGTFSDQTKGSPGSEGDAGMLTPTDETTVSQNSFYLTTAKALTETQTLALKLSRFYDHTHNLTFYSGDAWSKLSTEYLDIAYVYDKRPFMLSPGFVYIRERMNSDDYDIHSRKTASGYLNSSASTDLFVLSLTLRYDNSSDFDGEWTYHAGVQWNIHEHMGLKANIGTGYREPSMGELYTPSSYWTFILNPGLKPEKSFTWDVGPCLDFKHFGMGASYFMSSYQDLIKMDFPAPQTFTYINIDKAVATGIEAYAWSRPLEELRLSANCSFNQFRYASGEYKSKTLKHKPGQVMNLQMDYSPEIFAKNTNIFLAYQFRRGVYTNETNIERTGNRNIVNAGACVEVIENATVSLKADNIFNDRSVEYKDRSDWGSFWYPVPGRTYRLSIQMNI
ncbi:MAG TPA: TonB-dependent receptor [Deltaproteobacteria bacterium]|nr:TonB-dependent receptor [Deltaproteobacteria bacterium]